MLKSKVWSEHEPLPPQGVQASAPAKVCEPLNPALIYRRAEIQALGAAPDSVH